MLNDCRPHHSTEHIHKIGGSLGGSVTRYGRGYQPNNINRKLPTHDANACLSHFLVVCGSLRI
jgi:hypothetical protein